MEPSLLQGLIAISSTSNTSHCLAEKNVLGPTACSHVLPAPVLQQGHGRFLEIITKVFKCIPGGPRSGGTTILLCPPGFIPFKPNSNPARGSDRLVTQFTESHEF